MAESQAELTLQTQRQLWEKPEMIEVFIDTATQSTGNGDGEDGQYGVGSLS